MAVTMREIAAAVRKPESTIYRWRWDNPALYQAAKNYAENAKCCRGEEVSIGGMLPCPFCGSPGEVQRSVYSGAMHPGCTSCGLMMMGHASEEEAVNAWNTRPCGP